MYNSKRILSSILISVTLLYSLCGCANKSKTDEDSNSDIVRENRIEDIYQNPEELSGTNSETQEINSGKDSGLELPQNNSSENSAFVIPDKSSDSEHSKKELDINVLNIYNSKDIKTGDEHKYPDNGKIFYIAELELINNSDNPISIRSVFDIIPSVDDRVINLDNFINHFPLVLNGYNNLQNTPEITVYAQSEVKGYIGFEGPENFTVCELTFCNSIGVYDSFRFSKEGRDAAEKPEPLAKGEAEGLETAMYECRISDGSEYNITPAEEGFCCLTVTADITNTSERLIEADTESFKITCGEYSYTTIFPNSKTTIIPPGKHINRKFVVFIPSNTEKFTFVQTRMKDTVLFEYTLPHEQ